MKHRLDVHGSWFCPKGGRLKSFEQEPWNVLEKKQTNCSSNFDSSSLLRSCQISDPVVLVEIAKLCANADIIFYNFFIHLNKDKCLSSQIVSKNVSIV